MKNKKYLYIFLIIVPIIIFFVGRSFSLEYTQEIRSVEIESEDYDDPGSWHIDKSAKWVSFSEAEVNFDLSTIYKEIEDGMTPEDLVGELTPFLGKKIDKLNELMINFVKNFSLVNLKVLNPNDEDTINAVIYEVDMVIQYYDSLEPREADYVNAEKNLMGNDE